MSDYYSGYSLHQRNGGVPMAVMNDWMNPMAMFPSMQQQNFFKGTPVRAPDVSQRSAERKAEERPKLKSPCSNVPTRTLKRMQMFEARDWTTFQAPVLAVQPIDAMLPSSPQQEAPKPSLWQPSLTVQQQYSHNTWLRSSKHVAQSKAKGLVAIGEVSDSDSGKEEDVEHEQWMRELLATVNSVMSDHESEPVAENTQTHFQFEWLNQAKRGGVELNTQ